MSTAVTVVIIVVIVIVVVAVVVAALRARRQRELTQRRETAGELRQEAVARTTEVHRSDLEAKEAAAKAELARAQAEKAEREAAEASQEAAVTQAEQEDRVREADRIDPDVDHRAEGYRPVDPTTEPTGPAPEPLRANDDEAEGPTHRA